MIVTIYTIGLLSFILLNPDKVQCVWKVAVHLGSVVRFGCQNLQCIVIAHASLMN